MKATPEVWLAVSVFAYNNILPASWLFVWPASPPVFGQHWTHLLVGAFYTLEDSHGPTWMAWPRVRKTMNSTKQTGGELHLTMLVFGSVFERTHTRTRLYRSPMVRPVRVQQPSTNSLARRVLVLHWLGPILFHRCLAGGQSWVDVFLHSSSPERGRPGRSQRSKSMCML